MAPSGIEPPNYPRQGYSLPLAYEAATRLNISEIFKYNVSKLTNIIG